ncbi:hypothetical protein L6452_22964 [Arctium lappa]|uniref:Uncharacterized protein n=1 Tax=Arctium lappa TaxID=4217 RepID=A0ACB9B213_ARCLA|nr:hypothetical protein L6452_22964 [Arctium lappa]
MEGGITSDGFRRIGVPDELGQRWEFQVESSRVFFLIDGFGRRWRADGKREEGRYGGGGGLADDGALKRWRWFWVRRRWSDGCGGGSVGDRAMEVVVGPPTLERWRGWWVRR